MSEYTGGKWNIEDDYIVDKSGEVICHVYLRSEDDIGEQIMTESNAQLISAAPKMYEALKLLDDSFVFKRFIELLEGTTHSKDLINALQEGLKAIQKAEGDNDEN